MHQPLVGRGSGTVSPLSRTYILPKTSGQSDTTTFLVKTSRRGAPSLLSNVTFLSRFQRFPRQREGRAACRLPEDCQPIHPIRPFSAALFFRQSFKTPSTARCPAPLWYIHHHSTMRGAIQGRSVRPQLFHGRLLHLGSPCPQMRLQSDDDHLRAVSHQLRPSQGSYIRWRLPLRKMHQRRRRPSLCQRTPSTARQDRIRRAPNF